MKSVSKQEFEEVIQAIIDRKVTRKQAAKDLETDLRTLYNKITELLDTNPILFEKYIQEFPYTPKEIKVDIEDLAIAVIQNGARQTSTMTGISTRSISRKVHTLAQTNPELYELYVHRKDKRSELEEVKFQEKVESMRKSSIVERSELPEREAELKNTIVAFERLVESGLSKAEAARKLGYDGYPTIWKKYQNLKRLISEKEAKEGKREDNERIQGIFEGSRAKSFRERIKTDSIESMQERVEEAKIQERNVTETAKGKEEGR